MRPLPDASEVLPPIVEASAGAGSEPLGRHMSGYLGAVWRGGHSVPVLAYGDLSQILSATHD